MDNNYENMLKQMELEIDKLQAHFKSEEKRILTNITNLKGTQSRSSATLSDLHTAKASPPTHTAVEKKEEVSVDDIDKQLGGFYGSMELRDALKEAHKRMDAVVAVLNRVKEYVRSHFVRLEIDHLLQNIETLRKVFLRMLDRMEIPDSDDFFNDSMSESSTAVSIKASKESLDKTQNELSGEMPNAPPAAEGTSNKQ
ncbi:hypothetical protein Y032_0004g1787 [Ancylostoma ceylanicum]|uniref:Uncharacterized protein n=1 Tax=Ancylostoma ceylanicum TaxID=53326 RepID=A0A016VTS3_9BILA|nr:hypothetical protein Y032_0004g1787 [Ancylostoma ceylanicum]